MQYELLTNAHEAALQTQEQRATEISRLKALLADRDREIGEPPQFGGGYDKGRGGGGKGW